MQQDREKAVLITEISGSQNDNTIKNVVKLLDLLIQEARLDNDTADETRVRVNQGEIKAFVKLREYILRGLPSA